MGPLYALEQFLCRSGLFFFLSSAHLSLSLHLSARRREVESEKEMERGGKEQEADVECYISSVRAGALFHTLEHLQCEDTTEGLQSHTQVNKTMQ